MSIKQTLESKLTLEIRQLMNTGRAKVQVSVRLHKVEEPTDKYTGDLVILSIQDLEREVVLDDTVVEESGFNQATKKALEKNGNTITIEANVVGTSSIPITITPDSKEQFTIEVDEDFIHPAGMNVEDYLVTTSGVHSNKALQTLGGYDKTILNQAIKDYLKTLYGRVNGKTVEIALWEHIDLTEQAIKQFRSLIRELTFAEDELWLLTTYVQHAIRSGISRSPEDDSEGIYYGEIGNKMLEHVDIIDEHVNRMKHILDTESEFGNVGQPKTFKLKLSAMRLLGTDIYDKFVYIDNKVAGFAETYKYNADDELLNAIYKDVGRAINLINHLIVDTKKFIE